MDKKYNENWIVVIGQGFAFEVTHEVKHVLWMYAPRLLPHRKGEALLCTRSSHTPRRTPLRGRYFCDIAVLVCKAGARQVGT